MREPYDEQLVDVYEEVASLLRKVKMGTYNPDIDGTLDEILERLEGMLRD